MLTAVLVTSSLNGQDLKKIRAGLIGGVGGNWLSNSDKESFKSSAGMGLRWGLDVSIKLTDVLSISTGIQTNYFRAGNQFLDTTSLFIYDNADNAFVDISDQEFGDNNSLWIYYGQEKLAGKDWDLYRAKERRYIANYITIPLALKMYTEEIGYLKYFGRAGLNTSILFSGRVTEKEPNKLSVSSANPNLEKTNNYKDLSIFQWALTIGGGAEYNLTGTTSVLFQLDYNLGLTNFHGIASKKSRYLYDIKKNAREEQQATNQGVMLTVGILF